MLLRYVRKFLNKRCKSTNKCKNNILINEIYNTFKNNILKIRNILKTQFKILEEKLRFTKKCILTFYYDIFGLELGIGIKA
jgi:hypothetical protein